MRVFLATVLTLSVPLATFTPPRLAGATTTFQQPTDPQHHLDIAAAERAAYDQDWDPAHLQRAATELRAYIAAQSGNPDAQADVQAARQSLAEVEQLLAWEGGEAGSTTQAGSDAAPASPGHAGAPAPTATASALSPEERALMDEDQRILNRRVRSGRGAAISGFVFLGLGAVTLLFVSVPAVIMREIAEDRAERSGEPLLTSDSELRRRAALRHDVAVYSAITGAGIFTLGAILTASGLGVWIPARREQRRLRAQAGMTAGGFTLGVRGRF